MNALVAIRRSRGRLGAALCLHSRSVGIFCALPLFTLRQLPNQLTFGATGPDVITEQWEYQDNWLLYRTARNSISVLWIERGKGFSDK